MEYTDYKDSIQVLLYYSYYPWAEVEDEDRIIIQNYYLHEKDKSLRTLIVGKETVYSAIVVPRCWVEVVISLCHVPVGTNREVPHHNTESTLSQARSCFTWEGLETDVLDFVKRCEKCREKADAMCLPSGRMSGLTSFGTDFRQLFDFLNADQKPLVRKQLTQLQNEVQRLVYEEEKVKEDNRVKLLDAASQTEDLTFMAKAMSVVCYKMETLEDTLSDLAVLRYYVTHTKMRYLHDIKCLYSKTTEEHHLDKYFWNLASHGPYLKRLGHVKNLSSGDTTLHSSQYLDTRRSYQTFMKYTKERCLELKNLWTTTVTKRLRVPLGCEICKVSTAETGTENESDQNNNIPQVAKNNNASNAHSALHILEDVYRTYEVDPYNDNSRYNFRGLGASTVANRMVRTKQFMFMLEELDVYCSTVVPVINSRLGIFCDTRSRGFFLSLCYSTITECYILFKFNLSSMVVTFQLILELSYEQLETEISRMSYVKTENRSLPLKKSEFHQPGAVVYIPVSNAGLKHFLTTLNISSALVFDEYSYLLLGPFYNYMRFAESHKIDAKSFIYSMCKLESFVEYSFQIYKTWTRTVY